MSMGAFPSPSPLLLNYKSNPHARQNPPTPHPIVCGWCRCRCRWWSPPLNTQFLLLLFLIFYWVPHFTFLVSSQSVPTNSTTLTSPPLFLNTTHQSVHSNNNKSSSAFNLKLALAIAVPAVFLTLFLIMAFLKFLRFRIRRKQVSDRVVAVVPHGDNDDGVKDGRGVGRVGWEEIQRVTSNFSMSRVIGSGGFSTVYLAQFPDCSYRAVKIQCSSERLNQVYKQELRILLSLRHQNIVKLLGYCDDREEGVLVFEYVPNGTLQEMLHGSNGIASTAKALVLPWKTRMAIAFQLAQAIEYLHEKCSLHIVHSDIKASNILLDENLNCKLCDFGSAKMGFSSTVLPPSSSTMSRMIMGSQGYLDPHYLKTGIASRKNDVYSFGVIVLELITGREAFCSETGEKLTSKAAPLLNDAGKVGEMVDLRLNGDFDLEEAKAMASISAKCLSNSPSLRVSACDILTTMRGNIPSISFLKEERFDELSVCTKG